ncbi:hypothetical protein ACFL2K_03090 [Candidatus Margulisiibacteriota bacterium]
MLKIIALKSKDKPIKRFFIRLKTRINSAYKYFTNKTKETVVKIDSQLPKEVFPYTEIKEVVQDELDFFKAPRAWLGGANIFSVASSIFSAFSFVNYFLSGYHNLKKIIKTKILRKKGIVTKKREKRYRVIQLGFNAINSFWEAARFGVSIALVAGAAVISPAVSIAYSAITILSSTVEIIDSSFLFTKKYQRYKSRRKIFKKLKKTNLNIPRKARKILKARMNYKYKTVKLYGGDIEGLGLSTMKFLGNAGLIAGSICTGIVTALTAFSVAVPPIALSIGIGTLIGSACLALFPFFYRSLRHGYLAREHERKLGRCTFLELRKRNIIKTKNKFQKFLKRINVVGWFTDWVSDTCYKMRDIKTDNEFKLFTAGFATCALYAVSWPAFFFVWLFQKNIISEKMIFRKLKKEFYRAGPNQKEDLIKAISIFYTMPKSQVYLKLLNLKDLEKYKRIASELQENKEYVKKLKGINYEFKVKKTSQERIREYKNKALELQKTYLPKVKTNNKFFQKYFIQKQPLVFYDPKMKNIINIFEYKKALNKKPLLYGL